MSAPERQGEMAGHALQQPKLFVAVMVGSEPWAEAHHGADVPSDDDAHEQTGAGGQQELARQMRAVQDHGQDVFDLLGLAGGEYFV